jgi:hypothetical protein
MALDRVRQLAETYGGDMRRWPAEERAGLQALLDRLPEAQSLLRDAGKLDQLLDNWRVAPADWVLERRILAVASITAQRSAERPVRRLIGWLRAGVPGADWLGQQVLWPQVAGLVAAALIGFFIGISDFGTLDAASASDVDEALGGISSLETWQ